MSTKKKKILKENNNVKEGEKKNMKGKKDERKMKAKNK